MTSVVKLSKSYHELIDIFVCSRANKNCMIHRCSLYPEGDILRHLKNELYYQDGIDKDDSCINYKQ